MSNAVDLATPLTATTAANLFKNGVRYVGRYLSHSSWKALTATEAAIVKAAGLQIFSIYEKASTQVGYFTEAQGKADALDAYSLAKAVGQPEGSVIYFTVDYDVQPKDFPAILNYFEAIKANLKGYVLGCYGSYSILNYLHSQNISNYWFQTIAWSGGQRTNFNNLYQDQCDHKNWNGTGLNVDLLNLEKPDCGAWGQPVIKPEASTSATQSQPAGKKIGQVIIWEHTVVRKGPGASFDIVETVEKGDVYNVYAQNEGWLNVGAGWVSNKEGFFEVLPLKLMGTCTVRAQTAPVRKGPDASFAVVETVSKGGVYNVYDDIKGWYNIGAGWISDNDVTLRC